MPLLSKLFGPRGPVGDVATGNWDPVPTSVMAQELDLVQWLEAQEEPSPVVPPATAQDGHLGHFSPEELAIIEEQRARSTSGGAAPSASGPAPAAEGRLSWIDALKAFGEHLTDSELQALREQLAN